MLIFLVFDVRLLTATFHCYMKPPRPSTVGLPLGCFPTYHAKRLECAELAPAFEPSHTLAKRQQAGRTPNASRGSSATKTLAAYHADPAQVMEQPTRSGIAGLEPTEG
jgi:hypothetical protein